MIIISKHTNQLCNRLFTYLPVLSYALEAKEPVRFLFQYKGYNHFFPNLVKEGFTSYCQDTTLRPSISCKLLNMTIHFVDKFIHLVLKPGEKIPLHKPLGILFNPKWKEIRYDKGYIIKHAEYLRYLFTPDEEIWQAIKKLVPSPIENTVTVGVHIRGGDYRTYLKGRYFYEPEVYRKYMVQINELLEPTNKQVRFLICTNETFDPVIFKGLNILYQQGNDILVDLYGLSCCDYLMGPPSTFSQWASFYGKVPLKLLYSPNETFSLQDFKRIITLDTFE
ncbi:MAG: hypothetical protein IKJ42_07915 [Bacteroidaceae bacterium]|nr:hypothetical protein [Bacteroidaceae bacterium]MBR3896917.1 hypothetical protein [Bacteroidaceae bacterium]